MDRARTDLARPGRLILAPLVLLAVCGCQTVRVPEEKIATTNLPREKEMRSHPPYVVEPPDILTVQLLQPLPGRDLDGERLVRPDGTITLGWYGDVYVAGLTVAEIKEKIIIHLRKYLSDDALGLWAENDKGETTPVPPAESDQVFVDVSSYNSHVFYVLGDVAAPGRLPITGNETVLDALQYAGGLTPDAATNNIRLVRPAPPGACCPQTLPVNLPAIMQAGDVTTNYQLLPGDRLYVYRDPIVRTTIFLNRLAGPFNTVINTMTQYAFMARNVRSIDVPINGTTSGTKLNTGTSNLVNPVPAR